MGMTNLRSYLAFAGAGTSMAAPRVVARVGYSACPLGHGSQWSAVWSISVQALVQKAVLPTTEFPPVMPATYLQHFGAAVRILEGDRDQMAIV
jgi:hypothetical protein